MAEPKPEQVELLQQEQPKELKIKVERVGDGVVHPTTGAMGSVNPDGTTISVHLYYEKVTLTSITYHPLSEEGLANLKQGREEPRDSHLTRSIHSSTIMTPHAARILGEWLIKKSEEAGEAKVAIQKREEADHEHGDTTEE